MSDRFPQEWPNLPEQGAVVVEALVLLLIVRESSDLGRSGGVVFADVLLPDPSFLVMDYLVSAIRISWRSSSRRWSTTPALSAGQKLLRLLPNMSVSSANLLFSISKILCWISSSLGCLYYGFGNSLLRRSLLAYIV